MSDFTVVHIYHDDRRIKGIDKLTYVGSKIFDEDETQSSMLDESFLDTTSYRNNNTKNEDNTISGVGYCRSTMQNDIMNIVKGDSTSTWHKVETVGFSLIDKPDVEV